MHEAGIFEDMPNCICHLDLMPRNIMVETPNATSANISGILDWDSAVFAPFFVSCNPPSWIWDWAEEEDEDPAKANETPETPEMQELKQVFEDAVGSKFLTCSYNPEYQLARRLFDLAMH